MINFIFKPDPIFHNLVVKALATMHDMVSFCEDEYYPNGINYPDVCMLMPKTVLLRQIDILITYHSDEDYQYTVSQYHWLILYSAIRDMVDRHNDLTNKQRRKVSVDVGHIDFDDLFSMYFWDEDFLALPDKIREFDIDEKIKWSDPEFLHQFGLTQQDGVDLAAMSKGQLPPGGHIKVKIGDIPEERNRVDPDLIPPKYSDP